MESNTEYAVGVVGISEILGVSKESIYRRAVNVAEHQPEPRQVPGFKIGSRWKFFPSVVREHLTRPIDPWAYLPAAEAKLRRSRAALERIQL
ncbi:MAG: hypothetical protein EPO52_01490 [Herbiconiux sp.]|nr:MAG: hypothetical protein EPO52_01490 [Herbiconiux sp.]